MSAAKTIVIVGAAGGIGAATARHLSGTFNLVLVDLGTDLNGDGSSADRVEALAAELGAASTGAKAVVDDARDPEAVRRWCAVAEESFGGVPEALIWAAGHRRDRSLLKLDDDALDRELDLGVRAPVRALRGFAKEWIEHRIGGSFVLLSNPAAFFPANRQGGAGAAAAASTAIFRSAALELRRHGIRVNVVVPTARTRMTEDLPLFRRVTESSMGPQHIAPLLSYLCRDESQHISGEVLGMAGGRFYAFQSRETTGVISEEGPFSEARLPDVWFEATRG